MTKKIVIYTVATNGCDSIERLPVLLKNSSEIDCICFNDGTVEVDKSWKQIKIPNNDSNRKIKILAHKYLSEYEYSLYVDGNIKIRKMPNFIFKLINEKGYIWICKHPFRSNIIEEAEELIRLNIGDVGIIKKQVQNYKNSYNIKDNLFENNIIFRKHNDEKCINLMEAWWEEFEKWPSRDQLSLPIVMEMMNSEINQLKYCARGGEYFRIKIHKQKNQISYLAQLKRNFEANYAGSRIMILYNIINQNLKKSIKKLISKQ